MKCIIPFIKFSSILFVTTAPQAGAMQNLQNSYTKGERVRTSSKHVRSVQRKVAETKNETETDEEINGSTGKTPDEAAKYAIAIDHMFKLIKGTINDKFVPSAKVRYDNLGNAHVRLGRFCKDLSVRGGDSVVHLDKKNKVVGQSATFLEPINLDIDPKLYNHIKPDEKELIIFVDHCCPILGWDEVSHGVAPDGTFLVVHIIKDSLDNAVVSHFQETRTAKQTGWPGTPLSNEVSGRPKASMNLRKLHHATSKGDKKGLIRNLSEKASFDYTFYSDKIDDLLIDYSNSAYTLKDPRPHGIQVFDFNDAPLYNTDTDAYHCVGLSTATEVRSFKLPFGVDPSSSAISDWQAWLDDPRNRNTIAVDAQWGLEKLYDFFKTYHNIEGIIDAKNGKKVKSAYVHVGATDKENKVKSWDNSCFAPDSWALLFGDGDGKMYQPMVSLDFIAHEYAHGIIGTFISFRNGEGAEMMALEEANGDIIAAVVCHLNNLTGCWTIGEKEAELARPSYVRSFQNPSSDEYSFDCYCSKRSNTFSQGNEFYNVMGIVTHFFFLLVEGNNIATGKNAGHTCSVEDCNDGSTGMPITSGPVVATGNKVFHGIGVENIIDAESIWWEALSIYFTSHTKIIDARKYTAKVALLQFSNQNHEYVRKAECAWFYVLVGEEPPGGCSSPIQLLDCDTKFSSQKMMSFSVNDLINNQFVTRFSIDLRHFGQFHLEFFNEDNGSLSVMHGEKFISSASGDFILHPSKLQDKSTVVDVVIIFGSVPSDLNWHITIGCVILLPCDRYYSSDDFTFSEYNGIQVTAFSVDLRRTYGTFSVDFITDNAEKITIYYEGSLLLLPTIYNFDSEISLRLPDGGTSTVAVITIESTSFVPPAWGIVVGCPHL